MKHCAEKKELSLDKTKRELTEENKRERNQRVNKVLAIVKFVVLICILVALPLYLWFFQRDIIVSMSDLENVEKFFSQYQTTTILVYIAAQIFQIIICIVPGQWLQIAAAYMYGFWMGYLWSIIGAFLGSVITYYIAKLLGRDFVHMVFGEEKTNEYIRKLNSKNAVIIVFLIFLIPGVPKDLCNYIAGISQMKLKAFLIVSLIGRSPGMMGSLLIGQQLEAGIYGGAITIGVIAVILFILGIIFRKRLMKWFDRAYDKMMK